MINISWPFFRIMIDESRMTNDEFESRGPDGCIPVNCTWLFVIQAWFLPSSVGFRHFSLGSESGNHFGPGPVSNLADSGDLRKQVLPSPAE